MSSRCHRSPEEELAHSSCKGGGVGTRKAVIKEQFEPRSAGEVSDISIWEAENSQLSKSQRAIIRSMCELAAGSRREREEDDIVPKGGAGSPSRLPS